MMLTLVIARELSFSANICSQLSIQTCQSTPTIVCTPCDLGCLPFQCPSKGTTTDLYEVSGTFGSDDCVLQEQLDCSNCIECGSDCRKNIYKHNLCSFQFIENGIGDSKPDTLWENYKFLIIGILLLIVLFITLFIAYKARKSKGKVVKKYHTSYAGLFSIDSKDRSIIGKKADDIVETINALEGSHLKNDSKRISAPQAVLEKPDFTN